MVDFSMGMSNAVRNFWNNTEQFSKINFPDVSFVIADDIYEEINKRDADYAERLVSQGALNGLCYVNLEGKIELLVKKNDLVNMMSSIFHELVHAVDFNLLSEHIGETDIRKLQDNRVFVFWSEFHANYLTYRYLLKIGKGISPNDFLADLYTEQRKYLEENPVLHIEKTVDFYVRRYGAYMAVEDFFPEELNSRPSGILINNKLEDIYDFLYVHRAFDTVKDSVDELEEIILK